MLRIENGLDDIGSLFGSDGDRIEQEQDVDSERKDMVAGNGFSMEEEDDDHASWTASADRDVELCEQEEQLLFHLVTNPYLCAADDESQVTLVRAIGDLNGCVTHLVIGILARFDWWIGKYYGIWAGKLRRRE